MLSDLKYTNKWLVYGFLITCYTLIQLLTLEFLITEDVLYNTYADQLSVTQVEHIFTQQQRMWWLNYLIIPLIITCKSFLVSISILIGAIFFEVKISFPKAFGFTLLAELIMLIPKFTQVAWFLFVEELDTMIEFQDFMPWSLLFFLNNGDMEMWIKYPMAQINIFELLYAIILVWLIRSEFSAEEKPNATKTIVYGYGSGLFTWTVFVTFLIIHLS